MDAAQVSYPASGFTWGLLVAWSIAIFVLVAIPNWVVFTKAGQSGWKCLIPIYNIYILLKIVGRPGWWLLWIFVPIADVIVIIIVTNDLSTSFGHGIGFMLGLMFLSLIFYYILAFGTSTYRGPAAAMGAALPPPPPMPIG